MLFVGFLLVDVYLIKNQINGRKADNMLTIIEAAKYLNRSTKTIRKYIKDGKLTAIMEPAQFGNRYVIPLEVLEAFKEESLTHIPTMEIQQLEVSTPQPLEALQGLLLGLSEGQEVTAKEIAQLHEKLDEIRGMLMEQVQKEKPSLWARLWGKG